MPRINEHKFELNNEKYLLTWYDKPRLTKNGIEQKIKPILREYIRSENLPIKIVNSKGNDEVPYTLARKILEYFSNNSFKIKKTSPKAESKKKDKPNSSSITNPSNEIEKLSLSKNFKLVMICAGEKYNSVFTLYPRENFVNSPINPSEHHPDDTMEKEKITWRKYLINNQNDNKLKEAYNLYSRNEYRFLYKKFKNDFYILSAGWGLVKSEFKLPNYDITFSSKANQRNGRNDNLIGAPYYEDFNQLNINGEEDIVYIGSPDYIPLFFELTKNLKNRKIIYWKKLKTPLTYPIPNNTFIYRFYKTNTRMYWYYEVARDFCNGIIP